MTETTGLTDAAKLVKQAAHDEYVLAMLCPPDQREQVFTLLAFAHQLRGIPDHVTEPMMGRIRYQWWRDQLDLIAKGDTAARHELTDGLQKLGQGAENLKQSCSGHETVLDLTTAPASQQALSDLAAGCMLGLLQAMPGADQAEASGLETLAAGLELSYRLRHAIRKDFAAGRVFLPEDQLQVAALTSEKLRDFRPGPELFEIIAAQAQTSRLSLPLKRDLPKGPLCMLSSLAARRLKRIERCKGDFTNSAYDRPDALLAPALWWAGK